MNDSSSLTSGLVGYYWPPSVGAATQYVSYSYGSSNTSTILADISTPAPKKPKKPKLADLEWLRARVGEIVEYGAMT